MPKTHVEIVEEAEARLVAAICAFDIEELREIIHLPGWFTPMKPDRYLWESGTFKSIIPTSLE